nr:hypothetical protein [Tanacetum cinerariifolium]
MTFVDFSIDRTVNIKFLNSLPPEWSKFVTDVKLVKDFHTTNFNQLNAYLEQHELHANEVRIMCEHSQHPLALVANHQMTSSHFNTYQSSYNNPQFQQQFSPSQSPQYGSIHHTQHYSTTYPSIPRAITYSSASYPNAYSSTVHQDACPQPQSIPQIEYIISTVNQQTHLAEFLQIDSGLAVLRNYSNPRQQATIHDRRVTVQPVQGRQSSFTAGTSRTSCLKPKKKKDATWFRNKVLLVEAQGTGKVLNEEELEFLADPRIAEAKAVLMANFSSYESDVLSEETKNIDKEIALEKKVKELDNIVYKIGQSAQTMHMLTKPQVFYDNNLKQAFGFDNPFYLKKAQKIRPILYDGSVIAKETNVILIADSKETLMLEEESRSKFFLK